MKKKLRWILPLLVLTILVVARILAPPILRDKVNAYLADFSESYYGHIEDFDLSLWRGAYRFEKFTLTPKNDQKKIIGTASTVDVSIAWRELIRGRILMDVIADEIQLTIDNLAAQPAKQKPKQAAAEAGDAGKKLFPVETERVEIRNSRIEYKDLGLFADQIEGRLSNVTASSENPMALLSLRGFFMGKSAIKIVGDLDWVHKPISWLFRTEVQQYNLPDGDALFAKYVPLTFKKGKLDVYSEVKSEEGRISGYLKPFVKDAEIIGDDRDFKSIKHFGVEITVAFLNLFFRNSKDHTVAGKFLFSYENKKFDWNFSEVMGSLFKNGYQQELSRGVENILTLKTKELKDMKDKERNLK